MAVPAGKWIKEHLVWMTKSPQEMSPSEPLSCGFFLSARKMKRFEVVRNTKWCAHVCSDISNLYHGHLWLAIPAEKSEKSSLLLTIALVQMGHWSNCVLRSKIKFNPHGQLANSVKNRWGYEPLGFWRQRPSGWNASVFRPVGLALEPGRSQASTIVGSQNEHKVINKWQMFEEICSNSETLLNSISWISRYFDMNVAQNNRKNIKKKVLTFGYDPPSARWTAFHQASPPKNSWSTLMTTATAPWALMSWGRCATAWW